jgi:isoaspartyl peptidase/L-asparaginase-like protein (Ntn-hydrolase superfamily)
MSLSEACERSVAEASAQGGYAGVIAVDVHGNMHQAAASPHLAYVMYDSNIASLKASVA